MKIKGVYKNGSLYWVKVRIPSAIQAHYGGKSHLQSSLKTSDKDKALELAVPVLKKWAKEFMVLERSKSGTASIESIKLIEELWGDPDCLVDDGVERLQAEALRRAKGDIKVAEQIYEEVDPRVVLSSEERAYLVQQGFLRTQVTLADALTIYLSTHPRDSSKVEPISRLAIESLIKDIGKDIPLVELKRQHIKNWIEARLKDGDKTGTVERRLNQIKAILNRASLETDLNLRSTFERVSVPNAGHDVKTRHSPQAQELRNVLEVFREDHLMVFVTLFGGRVGEIAGLRKQDIVLDGDVPYVHIRPHEIRKLKTKNSERTFPLVGLALDAIQNILKNSRADSEGLLPSYYKDRGADGLSAVLNKRLRSAGFLNLTTHSFRHGMKDLLLREAGLPEHLVNELQGHGAEVISRSYGFGASLKIKRDALVKAYAILSNK